MVIAILLTQGTALTLVDVSQMIDDLLPMLNAKTIADLSIATEDQLYEFADEAVQRLSRRVALFVERDATLPISGGVSTLSVPPRPLSSIHAAWDSDGAGLFQPLRSSSVNELEALDSAWQTAAGDPERFTHDQEGHATVRVYKTPAGNTGLVLIFHQYHDTIDSSNITFNAPTPLGDYLLWSILAEVRGTDDDEAMPEVAEYARGRVELFESIFESYWGRAQ